MNTRKLIVKTAYGLIAALVLVLVGLLVYQQRVIRRMSDSHGQAPPPAAISDSGAGSRDEKQHTPDSGAAPEPLSSEVDRLRYHLEATEEELDIAREDLADERDRQAENASSLIDMQKKMMKNPAARKMIQTSLENSLGQAYGALFEKLGLPDEKIQALKTLLADYQLESLDASLELMDRSVSEEERTENMEALEDSKAEFEKQVRELLGSADFEQYEAYQERLTERQFAVSFFESLGAENALSEEKADELIEAMYEARKQVEAEYGIDSTDISQTIGDNGLSGDVMDRQMERMRSMFESYIQSARGVLSESQAAQFEAKMKEQQELVAASAQMARSLLGGGTDAQ